MSVHLTEEEQLENLKRWWAENGKSTVIIVLLAVTGYFGWSAWQDKNQADIYAASASYQNLMEAVTADQGQPLSDERRATVSHLVGELKDNYAFTLYASQAALFQAKLAVENGDLESAASELQWVIDTNVDETLTLLSRSRLARVKSAQKDYNAALAVLSETDVASFRGAFAEQRGDIYLLQGKTAEARAAYSLAMENLLPEQQPRRELIEVKINNLQTAVNLSASEASAAEPEVDSDGAGDNS